MKRLRTRYFRIALSASFGFSALFLAWMLLFGRKLAQTHFTGIADAVFAVLAMATGSLLLFCFMPFFRGDRRWYSISAMLTVVFLLGAGMLWQVPTVILS